MLIPYLLYRENERKHWNLPLPTSLENNVVADWYRSPWSAEKYKQFLAITTLDSTGLSDSYFQYLQALYNDAHYMDRYDIDWADVKNPYKLKSTTATQTLGHRSINFVSSNITRLYR